MRIKKLDQEETYVNAALVIKTTYDAWQEIKREIESRPDTKLIYQKVSPGPLRIVSPIEYKI